MGFFDFFKTKSIQEEIVLDKKEVDFSNFEFVANYIYEKSGITDLQNRSLTISRLKQLALSYDIYTTNDMLQKIKSDIDFYQESINIATVNETFFLREEKELKWLVEYIKNSSQSRFKILSLPCSSGEEVYSILLLLDMEDVDLNRIEIYGYDINSQAVDKAKSGIFDKHSLHKISDDMLDKYFIKVDDGYQIDSKLRQKAQFFQKNIFNISNESQKYDIVLSRNMFIYFDDIKRTKALSIIMELLKDGGLYIKGHADNIQQTTHLKQLVYGVYKFYQYPS